MAEQKDPTVWLVYHQVVPIEPWLSDEDQVWEWHGCGSEARAKEYRDEIREQGGKAYIWRAYPVRYPEDKRV